MPKQKLEKRPPAVTLRRPRLRYPLQFGLLLVTLALFNNWLLGAWLNPPLAGAATISELSIPTQPYAWLFRACDILAGALLLVLLWHWPDRFRDRTSRTIARVGVLALSVGSIVDASLPLDCRLNRAGECAARAANVGYMLHMTESTLSVLLLALLPIAAILYHRHYFSQKAIRLDIYSRWLIIIMLLWGADLFLRTYFNLGGQGYMQRLFMLMLSAWVVLWWLNLPRVQRVPGRVGVRN